MLPSLHSTSTPQTQPKTFKMAVPLSYGCDTTPVACPTQDPRVLVGLILTALYGIIVAFTIFAFQEKTTSKTTDQKTPTKRANKSPICPGAPKPKRQRVECSPKLSSVSRRLFADAVVAETDAALECPGAPMKQHTAPSTIEDIKSVSTVLQFAEDQIAGLKTTDTIPAQAPVVDIRTRPDRDELLSAETETICSFYKPESNLSCIENCLSADADTIDFTNPDRKKPDVKVVSIINYILTLNRLLKNLQVLNDNDIALPHAGNGVSTTRDDDEYLLVDKLNNAVLNAEVMNRQLSSILVNDFNRYKTSWETIPKKYVEVCQLSREAGIIARYLQQELSYNMNLTSWADW